MSDNQTIAEYDAVTDALHTLACRQGHSAARDAIVSWQDGYTKCSHLALIQELADSLQDKFTVNPEIESLPPA